MKKVFLDQLELSAQHVEEPPQVEEVVEENLEEESHGTSDLEEQIA